MTRVEGRNLEEGRDDRLAEVVAEYLAASADRGEARPYLYLRAVQQRAKVNRRVRR